MKLSESLITTLTALLLTTALAAQPSLEDKILPPAGMLSGQLDNGLSYMLMHNASPSDMVECRLIFRAGSAAPVFISTAESAAIAENVMTAAQIALLCLFSSCISALAAVFAVKSTRT